MRLLSQSQTVVKIKTKTKVMSDYFRHLTENRPKTKEGETIGQGRRWVEKVENRMSSRLETRSVNALGDKSTEGILIYQFNN